MRKQATLPRDYLATVRAQEDTIPSLIGGVTVIDSDSFALQGDPTHFNASGQDSMGKAVFDVFASAMTVDDIETVHLLPMEEGYGYPLDASGKGNDGKGVYSSPERVEFCGARAWCALWGARTSDVHLVRWRG